MHIVLLQKDTTAHNSPAMTMTMTMNLTMTTNFILITILQCRKNVQYIQKNIYICITCMKMALKSVYWIRRAYSLSQLTFFDKLFFVRNTEKRLKFYHIWICLIVFWQICNSWILYRSFSTFKYILKLITNFFTK